MLAQQQCQGRLSMRRPPSLHQARTPWPLGPLAGPLPEQHVWYPRERSNAAAVAPRCLPPIHLLLQAGVMQLPLYLTLHLGLDGSRGGGQCRRSHKERLQPAGKHTLRNPLRQAALVPQPPTPHTTSSRALQSASLTPILFGTYSFIVMGPCAAASPTTVRCPLPLPFCLIRGPPPPWHSVLHQWQGQ